MKTITVLDLAGNPIDVIRPYSQSNRGMIRDGIHRKNALKDQKDLDKINRDERPSIAGAIERAKRLRM